MTPGWLMTSERVCLRWPKRAVWKAAKTFEGSSSISGSSVSIPSSMEVSIMLLGDEVLVLRMMAGGRGSRRQPVT